MHDDNTSSLSSSSIHNLKRFYQTSLQMIEEHNLVQTDKRIVSMPAGFSNNSDDD